MSTKSVTRAEICKAFGVPPAIVGNFRCVYTAKETERLRREFLLKLLRFVERRGGDE